MSVDVQKHREEVIKLLNDVKVAQASMGKEIEYIKNINDRQEEHLVKINGRVWAHDRAISRIVGIGSAIVFIVPLIVLLITKLW